MADLQAARDGLDDFVRRFNDDAEAWRLLSQAEEALLRYGPAVTALEIAIGLSSRRDKKDLKRLAALREAQGEWDGLPLSPKELAELGDFLSEHISHETPEVDFRWTREWLRDRPVDYAERLLKAFESRGAFSDFQVLYNIVR